MGGECAEPTLMEVRTKLWTRQACNRRNGGLMFDRLKKVFLPAAKEVSVPSSRPQQMADHQVSQWAATQGFTVGGADSTRRLSLKGDVRGHPWRAEVGRPTRAFISGDELRAKADLGISTDLTALVMNRPLRKQLEKQVYEMFTDDVQTKADANLPQEIRWLAMYQEMTLVNLSTAFWERYTVVSSDRDAAKAWINTTLAQLLLSWPEPGVDASTPFMLMLLNGNAYLRMEYRPPDLQTFRHATTLFITACDSALTAVGNPTAKKG